MNYKGHKDKIYICENCFSEIAFKGYSNKHRFCDMKCAGEFKVKETKDKNLKLFLQGKLTRRDRIYEILVERDGNCCSVCKITEWNGKEIRLWVDHIDGNATNNSPNNFRLICPNCDSQSETFGAKNRGNGRKSKGLPQYG
ncbi:MAG: HNH endonuclease [Gammaproteobacteria bacterium]|nr:HNH endonuclease [Gammaproteobacteria bacterium]